MKTKILPSLGVAFLALGSIPAQSESFSAKSAGKGFTDITNDFTSAQSNPALLSKYDSDDDMYFSINLGLMVADKNDVIDKGEEVSDQIDAFQNQVDDIGNVPLGELSTYKDSLTTQANSIISTLAEIDNQPVSIREGINAVVIIPNQYLSFGMFANQYGRLGVSVDYDQEDETLLSDAISNEIFDKDNINSSAIGIGYSVSEVGVMAGFQLLENTHVDLSFGTKIKFQRVDVFYNNVNVNRFDEDEFDLTDDEFLTDSSGVNFDVGMYAAFGDERQWGVALVVNNLSESETILDEQNLAFTLEPSAKVGITYEIDWITLAAELDLTDQEHFQELKAVKYASVGAELKWAEHAQFRLGMRSDLNNNEDDIYTVGLGFSPWDIVSLDIAAFASDGTSAGFALQLGWKI